MPASSESRVVDESGEDYLFPARLFVPIEIPESAVKAFAGATRATRYQPLRRLD